MASGRPDKTRSLYLARRPFVTELASSCRAAQAAQAVSPVATRHALTEDAFLRTAVAMEGFFTEWLVRCVSMDTTMLRSTLESKASHFVTNQLPSWRRLPPAYQPSAVAAIPIPKRLSHEKVRELLGCETDNLPIRGITDLRQFVTDNIADVRGSYVRKLTTGEAKVVDATIAMRNFLVHRTERSRTALNTALQAAGMPENLHRTQNLGSGDSVGRYLCVTPSGGKPRFEDFIETLGSVAVKLAPYAGAPVTICP